MANRFMDLLKSKRRAPVVVAHRGDSFHAPENTLEAGRATREAGAPAWEIDVQLTRDGVPVLLHDESLKRTTDVASKFAGDPRGKAGWYVFDFDWREVESLDADAPAVPALTLVLPLDAPTPTEPTATPSES